MDKQQDVRSSSRAATNHIAGLRSPRGLSSARVIDLSMTGARLATHDVARVNEKVVLQTVRMGSRPGVVVRAGDGEIAIRFTDDLAREYESRTTPSED